MNRYSHLDDNDSKRRGLWLSIILHILIVFILFVPFMKSKKDDPDNLQGITVAFGEPEAPVQKEMVKASVPASSSKEIKKTETPKPVKQNAPAKVESKITTEEDSEVKAAEEKARKEAERLEAERQKELERQRLEEEQARKAAEEAARKAEEKSKAKSRFSSLLKSSNSDASASKGQKNGKPNGEALDNLTSGSGKVGTGLGSRELLEAPVISDNTQKTGRVIVNICVNSSGKVISAKFRQKGSTTTDAHLVGLAERSAKKYLFSKSSIQEQCGDIIIDFKLK